jgi:hypothetical protein
MFTYSLTTVAFLFGYINEQKYEDVINNPHIKLIIIDSNGGELYFGSMIGKFISDHNIDCVALNAKSAAFAIFQNCKLRILHNTKPKQLMYHAPYYKFGNTIAKIDLCDNHEVVMAIEPIRKRIKMAQEAFYAKIENDWFITAMDLLRYDIIDYESSHIVINKSTITIS